jgi:hypothetical protein
LLRHRRKHRLRIRRVTLHFDSPTAFEPIGFDVRGSRACPSSILGRKPLYPPVFVKSAEVIWIVGVSVDVFFSVCRLLKTGGLQRCDRLPFFRSGCWSAIRTALIRYITTKALICQERFGESSHVSAMDALGVDQRLRSFATLRMTSIRRWRYI